MTAEECSSRAQTCIKKGKLNRRTVVHKLLIELLASVLYSQMLLIYADNL